MNPFKQFLQSIMGSDNDAMDIHIPIEWLEPISEAAPCGPSLDYDTEFSVLQTRLAPKADIQYGTFEAAPPTIDWKEIERDSRRLLLRSKDISVFVWFTRARCHMAGAIGLFEGLLCLQQVLAKFEQHVHPQLYIEGMHDPAVRANAIEALCDPDGLLGDVRDVIISASTALRLTVRDVERAFALPKPAYALDTEMVRRQIEDLYQRKDKTLLALVGCLQSIEEINTWAQRNLEEDAPNLQPILKLLRTLLPQSGQFNQVESAPNSIYLAPQKNNPHSSLVLEPIAVNHEFPVLSSVDQREQIRSSLVQVREWIELHEPSSPVAVLLKQAERMWGKRFSEVAHIIPADLLQAWDRDE
jgi:type VI secretion system protein ImpA